VDLCRHRQHIKLLRLPESVAGCEECIAAGSPWRNLRICLECGHVGCGDTSPPALVSESSATSVWSTGTLVEVPASLGLGESEDEVDGDGEDDAGSPARVSSAPSSPHPAASSRTSRADRVPRDRFMTLRR